MKLYYVPGACSMAPHIVLRETGVAAQPILVDTRTRKANGVDFLKVNPKGYVPALELDNGEVLTEAAVILQYLAEQKPEAGLFPPPGSMDRYRCLEWLNFISTEVHKGFGPLWNPMAADEWKQQAKEKLATRFELVAEHLKNKPFLMGDRFTIADAYLFTILGWAGYHKVDLSRWPALMGYAERIAIRPAVQATLRAEGLMK